MHTTTENQQSTKQDSKRRNKGTTKQSENSKIILASSYLSIITLNANGLNSPIKRHRVAKRIRKQDHFTLSMRDSLNFKDIHRLKVKK